MLGQAVVVLVRMRDQHSEKAVVPLAKAGNRRQQFFVCALVVGRIERQANIKCEALALRFDFDAGSADFIRSPMYTEPHDPIPSLAA